MDFESGNTIGEALPFKDVIASLCSNGSKNEKSMRTAAVASALVEVVQEKLGATSFADVSPAAIYASAVNAITSALTSDNVESLDQSPLSSLLDILSQVIPYVSSSNPNLYIHQFSTTSRALRGIISSIPSPMHSSPHDQSSVSVGWNALLRQCIRTASITLNGILILENTKHLEKEVLRFFHSTIVQHFDDPRAKVRRQAHASTIELLQLSSSLDEEGNSSLSNLIPDQMVEYSHHIMLNYISQGGKKTKKKKQIIESEAQMKEKIVRLLHLLSFLDSSLSIFHLKGRLSLGQDLTKVFDKAVTNNDESQGQNNVMVSNSALAALLQIFDQGSREFVSEKNEQNQDEDSFCAQTWSSLLQLNASFVLSTKNLDARGGECRIAYTRCIVAIALRLLDKYGDVSIEDSIISALVQKLLPLSFTSVVNCIGDDEISAESAQSICAELGRIIRSSGLKQLLSKTERNISVDACVTSMQNILQYRFHTYWDCSLPLLASFVVGIVHGMIPTSGANEETMALMQLRVKSIVGGLVQLHTDASDKTTKQAVENAIDIVVRGIGLEIFMNLVDLSGDNPDLSKGAVSNERAWILSVAKTSLTNQSSPYHPRLAFFQTHVLGLARKCDLASASVKSTAAESSIQKSRVVDLWSLFPSFCINPTDIEVTFQTLAQTLVQAMADVRYPQIMTIICTGLSALANNVRTELHDTDMDNFSDSEKERRVLSKCSTKILPELFKLVETLHHTKSNQGKDNEMDMDDDNDEEEQNKNKLSMDAQRAMTVTDTIAAFAPLAPDAFLKGLFKKILKRLLASTQSETDETEKICSLLGLAQALVKSQSLNEESINLLYRSIKPFIRTDEQNSRVQKKAYKVFAEICQHYTSFATATERLNEIIELLIGSSIALQISARHMRLKCIKFIVDGFQSGNKAQMDVIPNMMGEVLLCLKDSNGKTRESAYQLLLSMAAVKEDMTEYLQIVVGALGAQTTHMRSAAVMALSRLVFEYARVDVTVQSLLPSLLQTVVVLFDENSREVMKSVIGFVRVSVAALNKDQLEPLLPEVVGGLMKFNRGKGRFRSKIKIILKRLVKTFGYEVITPLVPSSDSRLLTHMRKLAERAARRKAANVQDGHTTVGEFDDLMDSDEEDSDGGRTFMTGVTGFTKMTGTMSRKSMRSLASSKSVANTKGDKSAIKSMMSSKSNASMYPRIDTRGEKSGDILDMLDPKASKSVRFMQDQGEDSDYSDDDNEAMEFDDSGKLIVLEDERNNKEGAIEDDEMERVGKKMRISKFENAVAARDEAKGKKNQKKVKVKALGSAYKSKKAGGDVRKKNQQFDPYAYIPLDGRNFSKKNRGKSVEQMSTVVRQKGGGKRKRR